MKSDLIKVDGKLSTSGKSFYCNGTDGQVLPQGFPTSGSSPNEYVGYHVYASGATGSGPQSITGDPQVFGAGNAGWSLLSPNYSILVKECDVTSDQRIKKDIKSLPDQSAAFMGLNPVSYKYLDPAEGSRTVHGFIGQEIIKEYPDCVKVSKGLIPNVLKVAPVDADLKTIKTPLDDKKAKRVKLITRDSKELVVDIESASADAFVLKEPLTDKVTEIFVWGTEVADYHTVDYVQLIPALVKQVQVLTKMLTEGGGSRPDAVKPSPETLKDAEDAKKLKEDRIKRGEVLKPTPEPPVLERPKDEQKDEPKEKPLPAPEPAPEEPSAMAVDAAEKPAKKKRAPRKKRPRSDDDQDSK